MAQSRPPEVGADPNVDPQEVLKAYLAKNGMKGSRQREIIADVFFQAKGHLLVDELLDEVRKVDPKVSQATVYRTMKILTDCGLAEARQFQDGRTRYEISDSASEHHDHLICTKCEKIIEFVNEEVEALQESIAQRYGFVLTDHKMELYGICKDCAD